MFCANFKFHSCSIFLLLKLYSNFFHSINFCFQIKFQWVPSYDHGNFWSSISQCKRTKVQSCFLKIQELSKYITQTILLALQVFLQDGDCNVRFIRFEFCNFEFYGLRFGGLGIQTVGFSSFSEVRFMWQHISVWKNYTHLKIFQNNPTK